MALVVLAAAPHSWYVKQKCMVQYSLRRICFQKNLASHLQACVHLSCEISTLPLFETDSPSWHALAFCRNGRSVCLVFFLTFIDYMPRPFAKSTCARWCSLKLAQILLWSFWYVEAIPVYVFSQAVKALLAENVDLLQHFRRSRVEYFFQPGRILLEPDTENSLSYSRAQRDITNKIVLMIYLTLFTLLEFLKKYSLQPLPAKPFVT